MTSAPEPTFEQTQAELEQIVERLERGDVGARGADEALGARRGATAAVPRSSPTPRDEIEELAKRLGDETLHQEG